MRRCAILLIALCASPAVGEPYSHSYINSTRSGSWTVEQNVSLLYAEDANGKSFQTGAGTEFFGFWRNSLVSSINHIQIGDDFTYGYGLGVETKLVFESPIFNVGLLGGCSANNYTIPTKDNIRYESVQTYSGLMLERFWSYQISYGFSIKSILERYSQTEEPRHYISVGAF